MVCRKVHVAVSCIANFIGYIPEQNDTYSVERDCNKESIFPETVTCIDYVYVVYTIYAWLYIHNYV